MAANKYVIPATAEGGKPWGLITGVALVLAFGAIGIAVPSEPDPTVGFRVGLVFGAPAALIIFLFNSIRRHFRAKAIWKKHTYNWYRATFPEHAHADGKVTCRHCNGDKIRTTNIMQQTYMRVHACDRCGETLYFSKEKI